MLWNGWSLSLRLHPYVRLYKHRWVKGHEQRMPISPAMGLELTVEESHDFTPNSNVNTKRFQTTF
jgi:hypothetical protein